LTSHLRFYLGIAEYLASSTTSTFVTPNNAAFAKLLSSTTPGSPGASSAANDTSAIEALFPYHTLLCVHNASALSGKAQIISTALADPAYSNLGTGQVVQNFAEDNKTYFFSGVAKVDGCGSDFVHTGGVVHIVDTN
jgi:hypothetical protein